jgi:BirA family biotin operon repressor/biotin-[acetyl-CoA-carboxylase] ligase
MTQGSVQKMPGPAMKEVLLIERDECDSTNDYIRRNRKELEAKFPIAVVAAVQTKGRGREGRPWFSARGLGLYASFGFHFGPIQNIPLLSLVAGLAVSDIL